MQKPIKKKQIKVTPDSPREMIEKSNQIDRNNHYVRLWDELEKKGIKPEDVGVLLDMPNEILFGTLSSLKLSP